MRPEFLNLHFPIIFKIQFIYKFANSLANANIIISNAQITTMSLKGSVITIVHDVSTGRRPHCRVDEENEYPEHFTLHSLHKQPNEAYKKSKYC